MGKVSIMKFRPVRVQLNSKLLKSTWHCHDGGGGTVTKALRGPWEST